MMDAAELMGEAKKREIEMGARIRAEQLQAALKNGSRFVQGASPPSVPTRELEVAFRQRGLDIQTAAILSKEGFGSWNDIVECGLSNAELEEMGVASADARSNLLNALK